MFSLSAGTTVRLKVAREVSPHGYFLTDGDQDVLLHYSQVENSIQIGDEIEVFLFHDSEDRIAATMKKPILSYGEIGALQVVDVHPKLGCFLDMGLDRHVLLPLRELPELEALRPNVGDTVYVRLDRDKQGRLLARAAGEGDLAPLVVPAPQSWKGRWVDATVYKSLQMGSFVVCDAGVLGFGVLGLIHSAERIGLPRVGERLSVRVVFVREDGRVNVSMRKLKQEERVEDAERIYDYLRQRPGGAMPYSDETPADVIAKKFAISKGAFKRALGKLMKEGKVTQKQSWTYLAEPSEAIVSNDEETRR